MGERITVAALTVLTVAGVVVLLALRPVPSALESRVEPVVATVTGAERVAQGRAEVVVEVASGPALRAPRWSGLVTEVFVRPGDEIDTGTRVVEVDRVARIAVGSDRPFHRPLRRGDRGPDVAELERVLVSLGFSDLEPDGIFGYQTQAGVEALARDLGAGPKVRTFDPAWFLWLPEPFGIGELSVEVGDQAPPAGTIVARGARQIVAVSVLGDSDAPLDGRFSVTGTDVTVTVRGGVIADPSPLADLLGDEEELSEVRLEGVIREESSRSVLAVPTTALVTGEDGLCVWVERGSGFTPMGVRALDSSVQGATFVPRDGDLQEGDRVIVNPAEVGLSTCSS